MTWCSGIDIQSENRAWQDAHHNRDGCWLWKASVQNEILRLNSSLLCVKHFMLLLLFTEKCLDFLLWDSRLFMIGTFLLLDTSIATPAFCLLCLGCKISVLGLACSHLPSGFCPCWLCLEISSSFLASNLLPIQDWVHHLPGKHSQIFLFLPAPAVTPGLCPWPLLAEPKHSCV